MTAPNLKGQRFGRLTVIAQAGMCRGRTVWHCECDCGGYTKLITSVLRSGRTRSCGCLKRESGRLYGLKLAAKDGF